jgi:hypothetical protein
MEGFPPKFARGDEEEDEDEEDKVAMMGSGEEVGSSVLFDLYAWNDIFPNSLVLTVGARLLLLSCMA